MYLKTSCTIALTLALLSALVVLAGYTLIYGPMIGRPHDLIENLSSAGLGLLNAFLEIGGLAVFFVGLLNRLREPALDTKIIIRLAGVLLLLSAVAGLVINLVHIRHMFTHMQTFRFVHALVQYAVALLFRLSLALFMFSQSERSTPARGLAGATLGTVLLTLVLILTNLVVYADAYWNLDHLPTSLGSLAILLGYLLMHVAVAVYLFAHVNQFRAKPADGLPPV